VLVVLDVVVVPSSGDVSSMFRHPVRTTIREVTARSDITFFILVWVKVYFKEFVFMKKI